MVKDLTTGFQLLLLAVVGLAIAALILFATGRSGSPETTAEAESTPAPTSYVREVTALSDSLHDETEALIALLTIDADTAGRADLVASFEDRVRSAVERLETGSDAVAPEDFELLVSLFLDYLEAPLIVAESEALRPAIARDYLTGLETARLEVEGRLMRYFGAF